MPQCMPASVPAPASMHFCFNACLPLCLIACHNVCFLAQFFAYLSLYLYLPLCMPDLMPARCFAWLAVIPFSKPKIFVCQPAYVQSSRYACPASIPQCLPQRLTLWLPACLCTVMSHQSTSMPASNTAFPAFAYLPSSMPAFFHACLLD
jgi:hypothetical protein